MLQVSFVNGILSRIRAVYLVPEQVNQSSSYGVVDIPISIPYYQDPSDPSSITYSTYTLSLTGARIINTPERCVWFNKLYTGQSGLFNDWTDINANWYMNIPWYGSGTFSGTIVKRMIDEGSGSLMFRYYISPMDGAITVATAYSNDEQPLELLPWKQLPTIPVPSSSRTLSFRQVRAQEAAQLDVSQSQASANMVAAGATAGIAAVTSLVMGNPVAAGTSIVGGVAGIIGISVSSEISNRNAMLGSSMAALNITAEALNCSGYEMLAIMTLVLIRDKKSEILNVYPAIGYPTRALWRSVGAVNGYKYWISILGTIRGTSAYAQAVRGEIERDGIIYNYS